MVGVSDEKDGFDGLPLDACGLVLLQDLVGNRGTCASY